MRRIQLIGLLLWRGGLLFVGAAVLIEAVRWVLRFWTLPAQVEVGLGLLLCGCSLVILSLVWERLQDYRAEGDLCE